MKKERIALIAIGIIAAILFGMRISAYIPAALAWGMGFAMIVAVVIAAIIRRK